MPVFEVLAFHVLGTWTLLSAHVVVPQVLLALRFLVVRWFSVFPLEDLSGSVSATGRVSGQLDDFLQTLSLTTRWHDRPAAIPSHPN